MPCLLLSGSNPASTVICFWRALFAAILRYDEGVFRSGRRGDAGFVDCVCILEPDRQKNLARVFTGAFGLRPYLFYTYHLTGKHFYWANSGGLGLYWMASPDPNDFGSWFSEEDVATMPQLPPTGLFSKSSRGLITLRKTSFSKSGPSRIFGTTLVSSFLTWRQISAVCFSIIHSRISIAPADIAVPVPEQLGFCRDVFLRLSADKVPQTFTWGDCARLHCFACFHRRGVADLCRSEISLRHTAVYFYCHRLRRD